MHFNSFVVLPVLALCYAAAYPTATSTLYARDYFYAGGSYIQVNSGNTTSQYMVGQIYVEKLTPELVTKPYPIIFIAGAGQTGTNFLHTPDNREGWAQYFLSRGYVVYLTDQPERGRSPWFPGNGQMVELATSDAESLFTASQDFDFWPQASLHTQWPGTGRVGDPVFDAFYATQVQLQGDRLISEANNAAAYTALVDYLNQTVYLLTHSQAGSYGWRVGDARPNSVKKIVALEPPGPPFENDFPFTGRERTWGITDLAVEYDPPAGPNASYLSTFVRPAPPGTNLSDCILQTNPPKQLINLAKVPVLVVTSESSFHAPYDYCTVDYLTQAGVATEFLDLPKAGIRGNGHMMFMELNNLEIAKRILAWIEGGNW
jgi:pimeloyl-ACP methyl ester carboxylesterase